MDIYTAHYRYGGPDRADITVKGKVWPYSLLAPTWEMVTTYKEGKLPQWDYAIKYFSLLFNRVAFPGAGKAALEQIREAHRESITLVCFCPAGAFCHRILAARLFEELNFGVYRGERPI
jgi:hypothetical protein